MTLSRYFETDDGSLPEIEIGFGSPEAIVSALQHMVELGAKDVTRGGARLWMIKAAKEAPVIGPSDALLVSSGEADSYHFLVEGIKKSNTTIPALGVYVDPEALVLDYRMGPEWTSPRIGALLSLLKDFQSLGGKVNAESWWGQSGQLQLENQLSVA